MSDLQRKALAEEKYLRSINRIEGSFALNAAADIIVSLLSAKETAEARVKELEAEPTLQGLAAHLGWGSSMSAVDAFTFVSEREELLRLVQAALETYKSDASTAKGALLDRISTLHGEAVRAETNCWGC